MLQTPQRYPRAGSQSYPGPAAVPNPDGSTTVYFAPTKPAGVNEGNWIETDPTKGWNTLFRLYSPLDTFFTNSGGRARSNWCNETTCHDIECGLPCAVACLVQRRGAIANAGPSTGCQQRR